MPVSTDTPDGWMPDATRVSIPSSNYSTISSARKAVCLHIIEGSVASALSEFKAAGKQKSSHFVVSKAGLIWQCVSVNDSAYANGLSWNEAAHCWIDPQGHYLRPPNPSPAWPGLIPPINPNLTTISIEREGYYQDIPPTAQNAAVIKIMEWCADQYPSLSPYAFTHSLIGHCHISPMSKPNCPGPHVDYIGLASAANSIAIIITAHAGQYGAIARQDYMAAAPAAAYFVPGTAIELDSFAKNSYRHCVSQIGFIAEGDLDL